MTDRQKKRNADSALERKRLYQREGKRANEINILRQYF